MKNKTIAVAILATFAVANVVAVRSFFKFVELDLLAEKNARDTILKDVRNAKTTEEQLEILGRYKSEVEFQRIALRYQ